MKLNPGTYEGFARGYRGKLYVNVTVSEDRILSVKITKHREYRGIAWGLNTTPIELFPGLIVEYQSLNLPPVIRAATTKSAPPAQGAGGALPGRSLREATSCGR